MEDSQMQVGREKTHKGLLGVLIGISVVIVGLVVAIIVVGMRGSGTDEGGGVAQGGECYELDSAEDIQVCIDDVFNDDGDVDGLRTRYREAIKAAEVGGNYERAAELVAYQVDELLLLNDCSQALNVYGENDYGAYSDDAALYVYADAIGTSRSCGDVDAVEHWNNLYVELSNGRI